MPFWPRIQTYSSPSELSFFDIDDLEEHQDYLIYARKRWHFVDFDRQLPTLAEWYVSQFAGARDHQLIGEDATCYLSSPLATQRIARLLPHVKLIFLLRNPADRTYSHYWHMFKTGREMYSFEDSLMITPEAKFRRSRYKEHLARYYQSFARNQIFVVSFERFVADTRAVVSQILAFLGVPASPEVSFATHANPAKMPKSRFLRRFENRCFRRYVARLYAKGGGPSAAPADCR